MICSSPNQPPGSKLAVKSAVLGLLDLRIELLGSTSVASWRMFICSSAN